MDVQGDRRAPAYSRERLADVARRYYLEDRTKLDIARETGLSRFAVARMLDRARALGVVTIAVEGVDAGPRVPPMRRPGRQDAIDARAEVRPSPVVDEELSTRLAERLGLDEAVVVTVSGPASDVRRVVGVAAARWLGDCVAAGDVVACAGPAGPSRSAAAEAAAAFAPSAGVTVTGFPPGGRPDVRDGAGEDGVEDAWEAVTAAVSDPATALATPELRLVPHVVVVDGGAAAADALVGAALDGPATVVVTDTAAARAILGRHATR